MNNKEVKNFDINKKLIKNLKDSFKKILQILSKKNIIIKVYNLEK
jgi:hypothetical protein